MSIGESLWVAMESLSANKLRSVLTMLGIIIGVGAVIAIIAIGRGTQEAVLGEFSQMSEGLFMLTPTRPDPRNPNQRVEPFTADDLRNIRTLLPDVQELSTMVSISAPIRHERTALQADVTGTGAAIFEMLPWKLREGRWFSREEERIGARVVVLGADTPKRLMGEESGAVGRSFSIAGYPFQVIGVLESEDGPLARLVTVEDYSIYVPISIVQRMTGDKSIWSVWVKARPGADTDQVMQDAVALVDRTHSSARYEGINLAQVSEAVGNVTSILTGVLATLAGISLVVGGVGIMNIMLVSVTERTREIGIRKAIGASYHNILVQFLIEAVLLSLIGGLIGMALAAVPVWLVGRWLQIPLLIDWQSVLLAVGFSVAVGVVFGVIPAARAARLHPIEALRYE